MKKDAILLRLILIESLLYVTIQVHYQQKKNYRTAIKVNILNYKDIDFPEDSKFIWGNCKVHLYCSRFNLSKLENYFFEKDIDPNDLIVTVPKSNGDKLNLNLEKVKKSFKKKGILIRLSDKYCETVYENFEFNQNRLYKLFLLITNVTYDNIGLILTQKRLIYY